jgi:hypothetical protein
MKPCQKSYSRQDMPNTPSANPAKRNLVVPPRGGEVNERRSLVPSRREAESAKIEQAVQNDQNHTRSLERGQSPASESDSDSDFSEKLGTELTTSMVESHFEKTPTNFFPKQTFETLLTDLATKKNYKHGAEDIVLELLGKEPENHDEDDKALARYVLDGAKTLFLITFWIKREFPKSEQFHAAMASFRKHKFDDSKLPLEEWSGAQLKTDLDIHPFVRMEGHGKKKNGRIWTVSSIHRFQQDQWRFLAATISTAHTNHNFGQRTIPFISKHTKPGNGGAHGIVYRYEIHPAHFEDPHFPVMYIVFMACFID